MEKNRKAEGRRLVENKLNNTGGQTNVLLHTVVKIMEQNKEQGIKSTTVSNHDMDNDVSTAEMACADECDNNDKNSDRKTFFQLCLSNLWENRK